MGSKALGNVGWAVACLLSRAGTWIGRFLPPRLCYALAIPIADLCYLVLGRQRRILQQNLQRVVGAGAARDATRRAFRNFALYVIDFYQLPFRRRGELQKRLEFDNWEALDEALSHPGGSLFVSLHLGPAELGGAALAACGHEVHAVAETFGHGPMNAFIQGLRERLGLKIIPAKRARLGVLRCLRRGKVLALMFDAVQAGDSVSVKFFGAPAWMSATPARIALRSGARVLPAVMSRSPHDRQKLLPCIDFGLEFQPSGNEEEDVRALSQAIAASLQRQVERLPDQWFAFGPVWQDVQPVPPAPARQLWKEWSLGAAAALGGRVPRPLAYAAARLAGDLAYRFRRQARADVQDNMRHVLGPDAPAAVIDREAREVFRNVARYYIDLVRLAREGPRRVFRERLRVERFDILASRLQTGRGVIVTTAHCGSPELAVAAIGVAKGIDVLVLVEPLQPPSFAAIMKRVRASLGIKYAEAGVAGVGAALRHLRAGGCLAIVSDRDIQGRGELLPFFGSPARVPLGAAELAARTGAELIPVYSRRSGHGLEVVFEEPIELQKSDDARRDAVVNTLRLLERHQARIKQAPGQWIVLERFWKELPDCQPPQDPALQPERESAVPS